MAAVSTSYDELIADMDDETRATEWASSRHTMLTIGVSRAAVFDDIIDQDMCVVGPRDADEDGVRFFASYVTHARSNEEHSLVVVSADRLLSIVPDNLVGGRLLVGRDALDEWQLSVAETLTAYLPTLRHCELV